MTPERLKIAASVHIDIHLMESFAHAGQCVNVNCQRRCCSHLMQVATHARSCAEVKSENHFKCHLCRQVLALCAIHLENCQNPRCFIPFCARYKTCSIVPSEYSQYKKRNGIHTPVLTTRLTKIEVVNFYRFRKIVYNNYKKMMAKFPNHTNRECYQ